MCLFHKKINISYEFRLMNLNYKQNECPGINPVSLKYEWVDFPPQVARKTFHYPFPHISRMCQVMNNKIVNQLPSQNRQDFPHLTPLSKTKPS